MRYYRNGILGKTTPTQPLLLHVALHLFVNMNGLPVWSTVSHNNKSSDGAAALQSVSATSMQWLTSITVIVAVAIFGPLGSHAFPGGAPSGACVSLTPNHQLRSQASDVPGGYFIDTELRDENFVYNTSEQDSYDGTLYCNAKCVVVCYYLLLLTIYSL